MLQACESHRKYDLSLCDCAFLFFIRQPATRAEVTMNYHLRSRVRVGILAATVALVAVGCKEQPSAKAPAAEASIDPRTAVMLPADGQLAVLHEMRAMLGAVGGAMGAAARGDTAALFAAVAPAGSAAAADAELEALLPAAWKELAERTHGGFDSLVFAARKARGPQALSDTVLTRLARITGSCTSCHETFRVTVR
jgi:cytochrome c556